MTKLQASQNSSARRAKPHPRNAGETRARILDAARRLFTEKSYECVQTREIAALAEVDAALLNRYFGSKEKLFTHVVASLALRTPFESYEAMREAVLFAFTQRLEGRIEPSADPLRLILASSLSPAVSHIVSAFFLEQADRLASVLPGESKTTKANLVLAYLLGTLFLFRLVGSSETKTPDMALVVAQFEKLLDDLRD